MAIIRVGILITSDRSYKGERHDTTSQILTEKVTELGWQVVKSIILPDEIESITRTLTDWADNQQVDIILTSGGTGFSPRDVTPEATLNVIERNAPGLSETMRSQGLAKTPHAMLSRAVSGIRKSSIIINLPGSPTGALENLLVIVDVLPHAVELLKNNPASEEHHQK
jgi:molybdenum cofactor synthesis domain-containing protein